MFNLCFKTFLCIIDEGSFILHPSWITCLIKRMIFHESKFIKKQALSFAMNISFKKCLIHDLHSKVTILSIVYVNSSIGSKLNIGCR